MHELSLLTLGLFRFPITSVSPRKQWIAKVRRENWIPSSYSFLCSDHFLLTNYAKTSKRPRLK